MTSMISSGLAASVSIHGSVRMRQTLGSPSVQWPAWEQMPRLSWIVIRFPS
jgi:hypothetical protein